MFRILEVCEALQPKSLSGLDNTATDGVIGSVLPLLNLSKFPSKNC